MATLYVGRLRTPMCEVFEVIHNIVPVYLKKYCILKEDIY